MEHSFGADGLRRIKSTKATNSTKALDIEVTWENTDKNERSEDLTAT
jgi:hypothetical protein